MLLFSGTLYLWYVQIEFYHMLCYLLTASSLPAYISLRNYPRRLLTKEGLPKAGILGPLRSLLERR